MYYSHFIWQLVSKTFNRFLLNNSDCNGRKLCELDQPIRSQDSTQKESVHFMNPPTTRGLAGDKFFCQHLGHKFQSVRRTKILYYFEYFTSHIWTFIVFFFSMELNNVRLYLKHISFNSRHTFEQLVNIIGVKTISLALL